MAAVAVRPTTVRRTAAPRRQEVSRSAHSVVRRRKVSGVRGLFKTCAAVIGLALLFAYVNLYANLAATSASRARLLKECRIEKIINERLKLRLTQASVAPNIAERAESVGMVYATKYDYLSGPQTVARADR